jgi:two-component system OmpR family response regulator
MEDAMKILFAEDDRAIADYVTSGLREASHSVEHVTDGRDALTYCLYNSPDLAIMDRMMPGMDGLSVVRALSVVRVFGPESVLSLESIWLIWLA